MIAAALLLAGCGADQNPRTTTQERPAATATQAAVTGGANILTDAEVEQKRENTPERALLEWFQAVQFRDTVTARSLVTPSALAEAGRGRFDDAVTVIGSSLGRPHIVGAKTSSGQSTVRVLVLGYAPNKSDPVLSTPASFRLRRQGGWKIADASYLIDTARALSARPGD